jgi:glutathione S-transferase
MATPTLTLWDLPVIPDSDRWESLSPFVMKVDRALKLAKLPYQRRGVAPTQMHKLNPSRQFPVLTIDDEHVPDSTRILRRIEQLAPGSLTGGLQGAQLAEAWLWEEFGDVALYPFPLATRWADDRNWAGTRARAFAFLPPALRPIVAPLIRRRIIHSLLGRDFLRMGLQGLWARMEVTLDDLEKRAPETGFWLGPRPSVADISMFAQLHALRMPFTPWQANEIARRTKLSAWLDRVEAATLG